MPRGLSWLEIVKEVSKQKIGKKQMPEKRVNLTEHWGTEDQEVKGQARIMSQCLF